MADQRPWFHVAAIALMGAGIVVLLALLGTYAQSEIHNNVWNATGETHTRWIYHLAWLTLPTTGSIIVELWLGIVQLWQNQPSEGRRKCWQLLFTVTGGLSGSYFIIVLCGTCIRCDPPGPTPLSWLTVMTGAFALCVAGVFMLFLPITLARLACVCCWPICCPCRLSRHKDDALLSL